jgi:hypothetical protein
MALILKRASVLAHPASGTNYDVLADGAVVARIFKSAAAPVGAMVLDAGL